MISVVIPALNEEESMGSCIEAIRQSDEMAEIIVVDGGSSDRTREISESFQGVKVISAGRGRGLQMNEGALVASGDVLLFLHADTILQEGWSRSMNTLLQDSSVAGGAFTFEISPPGIRYRCIEGWVKLRCSLFKLPYGDQAIFVRRDVFKNIGGYKQIPLMEDVNLVERLKGEGRIVISDRRAVTSGRRWIKKGLIYTAVMNQCIMLLYRIGVSPHTLAKLYYR
jgi:rSAM/selenodomain-associated transferase 2